MDVVELNSNKKKFFGYNKLRLENSFKFLTDIQKIVLKLIPFLLHTNIKGLPGYVDSQNIPCGLTNYEITDQILNLASNRLNVNIKKVPDIKKCFIQSLSIMGSIGSIAQNDKSDFDYWVCIFKDDAGEAEYKFFLDKLKLIEEWSEKNEVETHFFPVDIKKVKMNNFGDANDESCGSAQAVLLKDEYFRSSIHLHGKIPFWWVLPPNLKKDEYKSNWEYCKTNFEGVTNDFINIGDIGNVNKEEFFGAGLWQLVKSLGSPFKSFIKMSLIEKYLNASSSVNLLSDELKKNVLLEDFGIEKIDQYILMFNSVCDYYEKISNEDAIKLLRTCFYLKVQPDISKNLNGFKYDVMKNFCNKWKWSEHEIQHLDNFNKWSLDNLVKFDANLKKYMINNFVKISNVLKSKSISSIMSEYDMTIIGRKLISYYSKKKSKVEYYYFSLQDNFYEPFINIFHDPERNNWKVIRGRYEQLKTEESFLSNGMIYQSTHLSEICLWLAYNNIYNEFQTALKIYSGKSVNFNNLRDFIIKIKQFFKTNSEVTHKNDYYLKDSIIVKCVVTINFDFLESESLEDISFIYLNSWGEMFSEHYKTQKEFIFKLKDILSSYKKIEHLIRFSDFFEFYVAEGAMNVSLPLKRIIEKIEQFYFKKKWFGSEEKVFITSVDGEYFAVCNYQSNVEIHSSSSNVELFDKLFIVKNRPVFYEYDNSVKDNALFATIFSKINLDANELFALNAGKYYIWLYFDSYNLPVLGAVSQEHYNDYFSAFSLFMQSLKITPQIFELKKDFSGGYSAVSTKKNFAPNKKTLPLNVEMIYAADQDISDINNYAVTFQTRRLVLSNKNDFNELISYLINRKEIFFYVAKIEIRNADNVVQNMQPSVYVKIKNKFEKFLFSAVNLFFEMKKNLNGNP
ncbi:MAG TPA: class I adenylate cyclase [bacterium]|nr:class I adenylate cyclase [bacterium]